MSRPGYRRPPMMALGRRNEAAVKGDPRKVRVHLFLWPADLARVDALILGKGGWGSSRGAFARIFAFGLAPAEAEHAARERWTGDDPAHEQEKAALHARFVAKGGAA